jgi:hypothetical protein
MKTPREILLAQHHAANPKLDALRLSVVAIVAREQRLEPAARTTLFQTLWHELILSSRRTWTGMAAIWAFILIVNFSQQDKVSSVTGKAVHPGGPVMSLQAQQRWMNELFADRALPPEADRPRNFSPKPRTAATRTVTV